MNQIEEITGYESVPSELTEYPNWIVWKKEVVKNSDGSIKVDENGEVKYTKIPYNPKTNLKASTNNSSTWADFNIALAKEMEYDGLGFVFTNTPFMGVDLDNISNEIAEFEAGNENNIFGQFYNQLKTYTEVSPSGNGVHLILKGKLPEGRKRKGNIEMYETARFFTVTGDQFGEYEEVNDGTELIKPLHNKYLGNETQSKNDIPIPNPEGNSLTIEELTKKASNAKNGDKFKALFFDGDTSQHNGDDSAADQALINIMWWWTNGDPDKADEWFRQSALMRDKWDELRGEHTYGLLTHMKAWKSFKGGYKAKDDFDFNIKGKSSDMKQLKENAQSPSIEEFEKREAHVLPDKNGVLWYLHEFASDREPEVRLVRKYYNYEKMASIVTDMFYNEFSEVVEYSNEGSHEMVDDPYISEMYSKISQLYIDVPQKDLYHIVNNLGRKDSYHPIKQLIESVEWDNQERVETFFIDYFGLNNTPYHREATRKWFIGAIARIYDAGVKFDMVPIIRGAQGVGKTTAIERLAFELDYYLSLNGEKVSDKDTMQLLRDSWLVELEELEFLSNNTDGSIKKFFSSRDDKYREPYGKSQRNYKRHSVFIGTVNNKSFLTDKTGNRRYYPLVIDDNSQGKYQVFSDLTKDIVHQIWAEALTYYKDKEGLVCSPETENAFDVIRGNVMEEDVTEQTLVDFLNLELPQEYYEATIEQKRLYLNGSGNKNWHIEPALRPDITTREILIECFGREIDADFRGDKSARKINSIMENLAGWKKSENLVRIGVDGKRKRPRGFERS